MKYRRSSLRLAKRFSLIGCLCVLTALAAVGAGLPGDLGAASVSLAWNANTESNITGYNVYYGTVSKTYTSKVNVGNFTSATLSGLNAGQTYYFAATALNSAGLESGYSNEVACAIPAAAPPPTTGTVAIAINAAGGAYTDTSGIAYKADCDYKGGYGSSTSGTITGATDPTVYRTLRVGTFSYTIPLANGNYNVTLEFAETYFHAKGQRVFNVSMNGTKMISALDVYARVGFDAALNITVPVSVTNGSLVIQFTPTVNAAIVNAIVIKQ